jgi:hypothetical protein
MRLYPKYLLSETGKQRGMVGSGGKVSEKYGTQYQKSMALCQKYGTQYHKSMALCQNQEAWKVPAAKYHKSIALSTTKVWHSAETKRHGTVGYRGKVSQKYDKISLRRNWPQRISEKYGFPRLKLLLFII